MESEWQVAGSSICSRMWHVYSRKWSDGAIEFTGSAMEIIYRNSNACIIRTV
jgi:hypothetical protein